MNHGESIGKKLVTMINYINYNTNNTNNSMNVYEKNIQGEQKKEVERPSASVVWQGERGVAFVPPGKLPTPWRGVKIDLFRNPRLKLKFSIIRQDNSKFECLAGMNSKPTQVFRKRSEMHSTEEFWHTVERVLELRKQQSNFRISKITKARKGGVLNNMAVALYRDVVWCVDLIYHDRVYQFHLTDDITERFRGANGIATCYVGQHQFRGHNLEDLGI